MRGKDVLCFCQCTRHGITPAYAGKRVQIPEYLGGGRDHPRVCGEKIRAIFKMAFSLGSPPRMRGKVKKTVLDLSRLGITPAYAGKSASLNVLTLVFRDHPRVCGEKRARLASERPTQGSPPRMRGKAKASGQSIQGYRITPAYAGKRLKRSRSTVSPVAIVPLFPSVCNKPVVSDGSPAGRDAPLFLPAENAVPASPAYNLRSL